MSVHKSFLDGAIDTPWQGGQMSGSNSQNDTLYDTQSQISGRADYAYPRQQTTAQSDDNRRLHQGQKTLKRSIDRASQESASSFSSLHEKASRLNLSISDLHSDLKRLERAVVCNNEPTRTSTVDMEIKLSNIVHGIEANIRSTISETVSASIEKRLCNELGQAERRLVTQLGSVKEDIAQAQAAIASLTRDLKAMASELQSEIKACQPVASSIPNQPCSTSQDLQPLSSHTSGQLLPMSLGDIPLLPFSPSNQLSAPPLPLSLQPPSLELAMPPATTSTHFVSVYHFIQEPRTICSSLFAIADAMKRVDNQCPCRIEGGWPVPLIKDKRFKK
ncbi:hypothetical protein GGI19_001846 [Coemansia pectinata]|uniref:Uncharacterized protein n=1 Tax=Coemansia pectinata TaxID=1052879 RepID=A0A9W8H0Q0_9FUNG|nr:hypothetical protein GGI19_001846 [Coemansia pectinata]